MKKERKQYNLRLSKDSLSDLKQLSIINDTSVSHEIRTAIKKHLKDIFAAGQNPIRKPYCLLKSM